MSEPTDAQRLAAIPKFTHEYIEVERIIARLRMLEIVP